MKKANKTMPNKKKGSPMPLVALAELDFKNGIYSIGGTTYAITDLLTGDGGFAFDPNDIESGVGYFPKTDQYPNFTSLWSALFARSNGFVVVFDSSQSGATPGAVQFHVGNADGSVNLSLTINNDGIGASSYQVTGETVSLIDASGSNPRVALRVTPSQFEAMMTGGTPQADNAPGTSWDSWVVGNAYFETGLSANCIISSIKFYDASADIAALVA